MSVARQHDLDRIEHALDVAGKALAPFTPGTIDATLKTGGDPLTAADTAVDEALRSALWNAGEGWLSEETADDGRRLSCDRTWIVDPIDGTREFIQGIPEWCVSVGLVEDGLPVAGGILSPAAGHRIVGSIETGVTLNGQPVAASGCASLAGALVLASRSEVKRGEWNRFFATEISVRNMGSVAYKLGLVAAGLADATWTLVPKNEWDVAAGAALVRAAGAEAWDLSGSPRQFNQPDPKMPGFVAATAGIAGQLPAFLGVG